MKSRIDKTIYKFEINEYNSKFWYKNGLNHRDNDKPAIIYHNGGMEWCKNGNYHRDRNLPAVIYSNGRMSWFKNGEFIRSSKK